MGSWWGAIHFKTTDRDLVRNAVIDVVPKRAIKCLLGPEINGWVSIYPQDNGQDTSVAEALAAATNLDAFHLLLCDDDVFAYNFFHGGKLVDEYTSKPGYFTNPDFAAEEKMVGRPELYEHLLLKPIDVARKILKRVPLEEISAFDAQEQFEAFAGLLGIANAMTAYEYLGEKEEREAITRWNEFERFPDPSIEKNKNKEAKAAIKRQIQALKAEGRLLAAYSGRKNDSPIWTSDRAGNGFLLAWRANGPQDRVTPIYRISPPWPAKPPEFDLPVEGRVLEMVGSNSGRWLVVGVQTGTRYSLQLWDLTTRTLARDFGAIGGRAMVFSADDRQLELTNSNEVQLVDVETGAITRTLSTNAAVGAAIHPSGKYLLIDQQTNVQLVQLEDTVANLRLIYFGGKNALAAALSAKLSAKVAHLDLAGYEQRLRQGMGKSMAKIMNLLAREEVAKGMPISEELAREHMQKQMEEQIQSSVKAMQEAVSGRGLIAAQSAERVGMMRFSADGTLLFCSTDKGLRVYEWEGVRSGGEDVQRTKFQHQSMWTRSDGYQFPAQVYALDEDTRRNQLIFGGMDGVLRQMDLANGKVETLFEIPEKGGILELKVNADSSAVACLCRSDMAATPGVMPPTLYVVGLS